MFLNIAHIYTYSEMKKSKPNQSRWKWREMRLKKTEGENEIKMGKIMHTSGK